MKIRSLFQQSFRNRWRLARCWLWVAALCERGSRHSALGRISCSCLLRLRPASAPGNAIYGQIKTARNTHREKLQQHIYLSPRSLSTANVGESTLVPARRQCPRPMACKTSPKSFVFLLCTCVCSTRCHARRRLHVRWNCVL